MRLVMLKICNKYVKNLNVAIISVVSEIYK